MPSTSIDKGTRNEGSRESALSGQDEHLTGRSIHFYQQDGGILYIILCVIGAAIKRGFFAAYETPHTQLQSSIHYKPDTEDISYYFSVSIPSSS